VLPGDAGGIAAALTVSDRRGISRPTVEALRATGLAHILAISGLHMALAAGLLYVGLRLIMAGISDLWLKAGRSRSSPLPVRW
jgi:competence protein ComEC